MTLRSFNPLFVSEFTVFDHFSNWKVFFSFFLPALFAGSLRSECARKKRAISDVFSA